LRGGYLVAGIILCLIGVGVVYYQVSESCEDNTLAGAYKGYPWCTDVLDHINLTFAGVVALLTGVAVLALGGPLHWILEPSSDSAGGPPAQSELRGGKPRGN
jgi:hypothetical protein